MSNFHAARLVMAVALAALLTAASAAAQNAPAELTRLVDSPTAGLLDKGRFGVDLRLFPDGGVVGLLHAGVLRRLSIGLAFGGSGIIGNDEIDWHPRVETAASYRLVEESQALPAVALGYESQGYGPWSGERYQVKSKGFYGVASKNYVSGFGQFGVHFGLNWSREREDDGDLSGWFGLDKTINEELAAVAEYDFALNDNDDDALGSGRGFLNLGVHWSPVAGLRLGFLMKNLFENGDGDVGPDPDVSRELSVRYTETF